MKVFGPIPSRRLGQSLGINNIPPKFCSYSCIYCQIGRTDKMQVKRDKFYEPEDILRDAEKKIKEVKEKGQHIDYISFVPDGEPTLDENLGKEIELLKVFGIKTAVITNGSLLWMDDVKKDLQMADWVSLKIDAADDKTWKRMDRPHGSLNIDNVLQSMKDFAKEFKGTLVTETMLVEGVNDHTECIRAIAEQVSQISPSKAYLLIPTRPPAEGSVTKPDRETLWEAYHIFRSQAAVEVECVTGDGGDNFFFTENIAEDLLNIAAVHPVREDIIRKLLEERNCSWDVIHDLIKQGVLEQFVYENKKFFVKKVAERKMK